MNNTGLCSGCTACLALLWLQSFGIQRLYIWSLTGLNRSISESLYLPTVIPVAIPTQTMNLFRGAGGTQHFLEAGHTVMVKYSNGKTMWGDYWAIILSLNGFCLWVRPCEHWSHTGLFHTLHYLIHHVASDVLLLNRLKRGQLKKAIFPHLLETICFSVSVNPNTTVVSGISSHYSTPTSTFPTPLHVPSVCIHSTLQLVNGTGCLEPTSVKVTSITYSTGAL